MRRTERKGLMEIKIGNIHSVAAMSLRPVRRVGGWSTMTALNRHRWSIQMDCGRVSIRDSFWVFLHIKKS